MPHYTNLCQRQIIILECFDEEIVEQSDECCDVYCKTTPSFNLQFHILIVLRAVKVLNGYGEKKVGDVYYSCLLRLIYNITMFKENSGVKPPVIKLTFLNMCSDC